MTTATQPSAVVEPPGLKPLEVASGMPLGLGRVYPRELWQRPTAGPRATLESLLLEALKDVPCIVAFSGGRDSSALLAEATRVARERGLPDPVPHTLRPVGHPRTREDEWQELVVRHLGIQEWTTRCVTDELDALGPRALAVLYAHGVHWPPNAHTLHLLLDAAEGGSLLTGNGGDELFGGWSGGRTWRIRHGEARPAWGDIGPVALSLLPHRLHARISLARHPFHLPWLKRGVQGAQAREFALDWSRRHRSWAEALEHEIRGRPRELSLGTVRAIAAERGVRLIQPFTEVTYMRAVAAAAPRAGYRTRSEAMAVLFGEALPRELVERPSKAIFTEAFAGPRVRHFARSWDGSGLDEALVDVEALRAEWLAAAPDVRSLVPIQAAWLASG